VVGCDYYLVYDSGDTEQVLVLRSISKKGDNRYLNFSWIDKTGKVVGDSILIGSVSTKNPVMAIFYQKVPDMYPVSDIETKPLTVEELESRFVTDHMAGQNAKILIVEDGNNNRVLNTLTLYKP
jgi:hypothetical protein